uniref:histidinol dehydrogenase n=1 Tax=Nocardia abscessus TaxID=120957 RepID=UPI002456227D
YGRATARGGGPLRPPAPGGLRNGKHPHGPVLDFPPGVWAAFTAGVRRAGAVFVGAYAPVSLGDYCAGSNHVLPTAGCARHSSGLSVQTFLRGIHVVEYTEAALKDVAGHVVALANAEDLPAHGQAVQARFEALS